MQGEVIVILHRPPPYPLPQRKSPIVACVSITRRYERLVEAEAKLKQVQDEKQQLETHMSAMLKAWEVRVSTVTRTNISAKAHFAQLFLSLCDGLDRKKRPCSRTCDVITPKLSSRARH